MKLGILTFHYAPSYGAFFQAFALAKYLRGLGHEVVVVDYVPKHRSAAFNIRARFVRRRWGLTRSNLSWFKEWCRISFYITRRWVFSHAVRNYLPLSSRRYETIEDLRESPPELDLCFVGSDQIWNPEKTGGRFDPAYFASFGPKEMRRVAYAASFGRDSVLDPDGQLASLLNMLDRISVREASAVPVVAQYTGKNATVVVDPVFLLSSEDYPATIVRQKTQPYVLGYFIGTSDSPRQLLRSIARSLGLPALDLTRSRTSLWGLVYPGPWQMLRLLRNARYVVTNSFHGLALAINFQIDFTSVGLEGPQVGLNVRMRDLLGALGLDDRFVANPAKIRPSDLRLSPVCWSDVDRRLAPLRHRSKDFIDEATGL